MEKNLLKLLKFKKNEKISKVISAFNITAPYTDGKGFGVVIDNNERCIGVITDGDVRRVLNKYNKNDSIKHTFNKSFSFASNDSSKTAILQIFEKLINNKNYHLSLPVLDKKKKLIDIINFKNFLEEEKKPKCIRVKIPARISFVGGGTDFSEYLHKSRSYILSSTIQKYLTVSLYPRNDKKITIFNYTNNKFNYFKDYTKLNEYNKNDLAINILKNRFLIFGFDLEISSDFAPQTGLGGSSILSVAILEVINLFKKNEETDKYKLINEAYKLERLDSKIKGGWQDYLTSTFGGFNWIDLYKSDFYVNQINIDNKIKLELENNLVLIELGSRRKNDIQINKINSYKKNPKSKISIFNKIRRLSIDMKNYLIKGELEKFGKSMDQSWKLKKMISPESTTKKINEIYNLAKNAGALGGKILGTGQSGYLLLYIASNNLHGLNNKLKNFNSKLKLEKVNFTSDGLNYWKVF